MKTLHGYRTIDFLYDERERMLQPVSDKARRLARTLGEPLSVPGLRARGFYLFTESVHNFTKRGRRYLATERV